MQLAEPISVSIPKKEQEQVYTVDKAELKKLRKASILSLEGYVLIAIRMTYSSDKPSIHASTFCEQWKITEDELELAIAKLQKKNLLHRPSTTIQLELFEYTEEE